MTASAPLSLTVLGPTGATIRDARAVVISGGYELLRGSARAPLVGDEQGRIHIGELGARSDNAIALVWSSVHAPARFEILARHGQSEWRVHLPAATTLHGRVTPERKGDKRVDEVWLQAVNHDAPWPYFVQIAVDGKGLFRAGGIAPGKFRISSRPVGGAPVFAFDERGVGRFVATEPARIPVLPYGFKDREITADGRRHEVRVGFGRTLVVGRVLDEAGAPIADAEVQLSSESPGQQTVKTNGEGAFEAEVRPTPNLRLAASHPDFGKQWTDFQWHGWSQYGEIPEQAVTLRLRRGVTLRGTLVDETGKPRSRERILLIPAYVGSGPATLTTTTDSAGRFTFERAVLDQFELVPRSLAHWHPQTGGRAGRFLRIVQDAEGWLKRAQSGQPVTLTRQEYVLVQLSIQLSREGGEKLANQQLDVWIRSGPHQYLGLAPYTDSEGRTQVLMERGVSYELWADLLAAGASKEAPWTRGAAPRWTGALTESSDIALTIPAR